MRKWKLSTRPDAWIRSCILDKSSANLLMRMMITRVDHLSLAIQYFILLSSIASAIQKIYSITLALIFSHGILDIACQTRIKSIKYVNIWPNFSPKMARYDGKYYLSHLICKTLIKSYMLWFWSFLLLKLVIYLDTLYVKRALFRVATNKLQINFPVPSPSLSKHFKNLSKTYICLTL